MSWVFGAKGDKKQGGRILFYPLGLGPQILNLGALKGSPGEI